MKNTALLNAVIENAIDGIITISERGIVESINPAACALFAYRPREVIGRNISVLMPAPDKDDHDSYIENYKRTGRGHIIGFGRDVVGKRKDGTVFPFRLGVSEVRFENVRMFAGFIHDLSHQKEAENRLKEYTLHLEDLVKERTATLNETIEALTQTKEDLSESLKKEKELGKLKSRLLSMASHEFRTPLSAVNLSVSLLDRYTESLHNGNITRHIHKIKKAVTNLTTILDDFLHVEKAEAGKIAVSRSYFDLKLFALEIMEEMQLLAKPGQQIIHSHSGSDNTVRLDFNLLKNSMINLVSNATKYSAEDTMIHVTTCTDTGNGTCTLTIEDQGIGIPHDEQKHLFEAFFRAQNTGNTPGTGLGLNIVARYVKLMGGDIAFKSQENIGSIFTITLPTT